MNVSLRVVKHFANGYSGKTQAIYEKRKFPRYPVMKTAVCFRYGRQMTMRTINISLGGLKVEANFDLRVGESMVFAILTNGIRIQCKGRILAIEELKNKVHARLCFAHTSDKDIRNLSDYLDTLSPGRGDIVPKGSHRWPINPLGLYRLPHHPHLLVPMIYRPPSFRSGQPKSSLIDRCGTMTAAL